MTSCNTCQNLESTIEGQKEFKHIKNTCTKHKVDVKLTSKLFKDRIRPCVECRGKDFKFKEVVNLGKL